jgi:hypothetical protein
MGEATSRTAPCLARMPWHNMHSVDHIAPHCRLHDAPSCRCRYNGSSFTCGSDPTACLPPHLSTGTQSLAPPATAHACSRQAAARSEPHTCGTCRCYSWQTTAATQAVAQSSCASQGGNLAMYTSYEEQLAVEAYFVAQGQWASLDNFG